MNYDITDATADGAQKSPPSLDYASICGLPHETTDLDTGLGVVVYVDSADGYDTRDCENCVYIKTDYEAWLKAREAAA